MFRYKRIEGKIVSLLPAARCRQRPNVLTIKDLVGVILEKNKRCKIWAELSWFDDFILIKTTGNKVSWKVGSGRTLCSSAWYKGCVRSILGGSSIAIGDQKYLTGPPQFWSKQTAPKPVRANLAIFSDNDDPFRFEINILSMWAFFQRKLAVWGVYLALFWLWGRRLNPTAIFWE